MKFISGLDAKQGTTYPAFNDANILVITARSLVKNSIARYLRQSGYQNVECLTGHGLIKETVAQFSPDLIVLDGEISMSESIFATLLSARERGGRMNFILIVPKATQATDLVGDGFSVSLIEKPFKSEELGLCVQNSLQDACRSKAVPMSKLASLTSKLSQTINQTFFRQ